MFLIIRYFFKALKNQFPIRFGLIDTLAQKYFKCKHFKQFFENFSVRYVLLSHKFSMLCYVKYSSPFNRFSTFEFKLPLVFFFLLLLCFCAYMNLLPFVYFVLFFFHDKICKRSIGIPKTV